MLWGSFFVHGVVVDWPLLGHVADWFDLGFVPIAGCSRYLVDVVVGLVYPAMNRWVIIGCPCGTECCAESLWYSCELQGCCGLFRPRVRAGCLLGEVLGRVLVGAFYLAINRWANIDCP